MTDLADGHVWGRLDDCPACLDRDAPGGIASRFRHIDLLADRSLRPAPGNDPEELDLFTSTGADL